LCSDGERGHAERYGEPDPSAILSNASTGLRCLFKPTRQYRHSAIGVQ